MLRRRTISLCCALVLILLGGCSWGSTSTPAAPAAPGIDDQPASVAANPSTADGSESVSTRIELAIAPGQVFDVDGPTLEGRAKELWDLPRWTPAPGRPGTWITSTGDNTRYSYTVDSTGEQQVQTVAVTFDVELQDDVAYFVAGPALKAGSLTAPDNDTGTLLGLDIVDALSSGSVDTADGIATFAPSDKLTAVALLDRDQSSLTLVFQPNQPTEALTPEPEPFVAEPGPTTEPSRVATDTERATTSSTSRAVTDSEPASSTTTAPAPTTSTSTTQAPSTGTIGTTTTEAIDTTPDCHPAYSRPCLPPNGPDLNCSDVRQLVIVRDVDNDPHGLDGNDRDGRGCESYA